MPKSLEELSLVVAESAAFFVPDGDHSWLLHPSIIASRRYMAKLHIGQYRKSDGAPEETHALEVADWTINNIDQRILDKFGREFVAYIMYSHDVFEDYDEDIKDYVSKTWKGNPERIPDAIKYLNYFTDTPELNRSDRLNEQIIRSAFEKTGLVAVGRYWDKWCSLRRDHKTTLNGKIPFNGNEVKFLDYTTFRMPLVESLNLKHAMNLERAANPDPTRCDINMRDNYAKDMKDAYATLAKNTINNVNALVNLRDTRKRWSFQSLSKKVSSLALL